MGFLHIQFLADLTTIEMDFMIMNLILLFRIYIKILGNNCNPSYAKHPKMLSARGEKPAVNRLGDERVDSYW